MISTVDFKSKILPPMGIKGIAKVARGWFLGCDLSLDCMGEMVPEVIYVFCSEGPWEVIILEGTCLISLTLRNLMEDMLPLGEEQMVAELPVKKLLKMATLDESMLWHRRLGHINFKNINKLVKDKLVRGLPSKRFENDQTCVACLKGNQHKASCKSKIQNSISQPLFMLHMDLFGPTFVRSLMYKQYGLVVIDDYSRYTWVFLLATKNEATGILKKFITEIENLVDKKVKVIRCNNRTEFKNSVMNDFCAMEVKPHNNTPYELFRGRTPAVSFIRPFGCHVTILNTLDHFGKFDGKADEGYFVRYSMNSKAFRVYNIRTRRVEENFHIEFMENKNIVAGARPEWLFNINMLTKSINYVPVIASTNFDDFADGSPLFNYSLKISGDAGKKHDEVSNKENRASNELNYAFEKLNTEYPDNPKMHGLETIATYDDFEEVADFTNLESSIHVCPTPTTRTHKDHPLKKGHTQEEGINYDEVFALVARIEAIRLFLAYASFMRFMVYQMDVKNAFLFGRIKEEVYVCQPPGFEDPNNPDKVYKVVYVDDIIFGSTKKELCTEFERLMKDKFQMSSKGELTFFLGLQVKQKEDGIFISRDKYVTKVLRKFNFLDVKFSNTPVDRKKTLANYENGADVDVYLYRSMIVSLMYLIASRPDIMYAAFWYPKDSPFKLVAYTDSDYAEASLDKKYTTGSCQFLRSRLISW
nr:hypothetical protein [Tanacetum cinerariifolium]